VGAHVQIDLALQIQLPRHTKRPDDNIRTDSALLRHIAVWEFDLPVCRVVYGRDTDLLPRGGDDI
jgi:hypothetical protein